MKLSDDFFEKWEHIISDVEEKTAVPLECVDRVVIRMSGRRRKTLNINSLRRKGLDSEDIEDVLNQLLQELDDQVVDLEFRLDVEAVAALVQPETNKLLNGL